MRLSRLGTASGIVFSLALLAACGGGGGGGSVTPPGGGNSGGSTPTPTPVTSGSPAPSPSPSTVPTSTPTTAPTMLPTSSPTPLQTATPLPTPTPNSTPNSKDTVRTGDGIVNGQDDVFKSSAPNTHNNSGEGDLTPSDPGAQPQGGGQGAMVDNIPCNSGSMSNDYHVHAFVGIINNGTGAFSNANEVALPDAIGITNPRGEFTDNTDPSNPIPNQEIYGDCFYFLHTHDASGLVHMEAPQQFTGVAPCGAAATPQYSVYCTGSYFTLGNLLDIWGISLTPANFGPLQGTVGIYATPQTYWFCPSGPCYRPSNQYQAIDPSQWTSYHLYLHSVVWIVIGAQPNQPSSLPNIEWLTGGGN